MPLLKLEHRLKVLFNLQNLQKSNRCLRCVFDENAYNKKSLDGVPLRILNSRTSCDKAKTFCKWLLGAFEAIEKKYLRELALVIYEDAAPPEEVKEVYTVKVSYPGGLPSCKVGNEQFVESLLNIFLFVLRIISNFPLFSPL